MLLPSVENTSKTPLNRQNKPVVSENSSIAKQAASESSIKSALQYPKINKIDDKSTGQTKPPQPPEGLEPLDKSIFSTDGQGLNSGYPDYTLELSSKMGSSSVPAIDLKPDEIRFGRKRPTLPITFSFGIRRSQAVAVAMRHPLLDGKQPSTANQAILDTFDLAATNRLPYVKGTGINIAA